MSWGSPAIRSFHFVRCGKRAGRRGRSGRRCGRSSPRSRRLEPAHARPRPPPGRARRLARSFRPGRPMASWRPRAPAARARRPHEARRIGRAGSAGRAAADRSYNDYGPIRTTRRTRRHHHARCATRERRKDDTGPGPGRAARRRRRWRARSTSSRPALRRAGGSSFTWPENSLFPDARSLAQTLTAGLSGGSTGRPVPRAGGGRHRYSRGSADGPDPQHHGCRPARRRGAGERRRRPGPDPHRRCGRRLGGGPLRHAGPGGGGHPLRPGAYAGGTDAYRWDDSPARH